MDGEPTTALVQRYLNALAGDTPAEPIIRALLDEASRKNYGGGILGVRARPEWTTAPEFNYGAALVRVVPCGSALAGSPARIVAFENRLPERSGPSESRIQV